MIEAEIENKEAPINQVEEVVVEVVEKEPECAKVEIEEKPEIKVVLPHEEEKKISPKKEKEEASSSDDGSEGNFCEDMSPRFLSSVLAETTPKEKESKE